MKCWDEYTKYLKNNPEGYWFKNKMYGCGWTPARLVGWVVIGVYLNLIIGLVIYAEVTSLADRDPLRFVSLITAATVLLVVVCWRTGEPLKWRWGNKSEDTKSE